jgi:hypothetical protein
MLSLHADILSCFQERLAAMTDFSSTFSTSSATLLNQTNHRTRLHTVLPEGNTTTTSPNGTGATQSFSSILAGITGAGNAAKRSD